MNEQVIQTKQCAQCKSPFVITDKDLSLLEKISPIIANKKYLIPSPTLCPHCRQQRRMASRNERKFYKRTCSMTGKSIVSMYHTDVPFPVYSPEARFSDQWEALDYGQDYDFSKPFFEQYHELQNKVPKISLISDNNQNCEYTNLVSDSKNCYLIFGSTNCEDCLYGSPYRCKDCVDSLVLRDSEFCYECTDSSGLYNCAYCRDCTKSSHLRHCLGVEGSTDCFGCVGLINKQYCIFNVQYTKEKYLAELENKKGMQKEAIKKEMDTLISTVPRRYYVGTHNEQSQGNYIFHTARCAQVFDSSDVEDSAYLTYTTTAKSVIDCDYGEYAELVYENCGFFRIQKVAFGSMNWIASDNLRYCSLCYNNVHNCFGCIALKHKDYCILNKQYTKEEYEALIPKIIDHMTTTGERGSFFPASISSFGYNESSAQDYYPLSREEALAQRYKWLEKEYPINIPVDAQTIQAKDLPEDIAQVTDDILNQVILCEVTGKPFRIMKPELELYRKLKLPLPKRHPDQRHTERMQSRNTRTLWDRQCAKCGIDIRTTYSPERKEKMYCEECYNKEVYG